MITRCTSLNNIPTYLKAEFLNLKDQILISMSVAIPLGPLPLGPLSVEDFLSANEDKAAELALEMMDKRYNDLENDLYRLLDNIRCTANDPTPGATVTLVFDNTVCLAKKFINGSATVIETVSDSAGDETNVSVVNQYSRVISNVVTVGDVTTVTLASYTCHAEYVASTDNTILHQDQ